MDINKPKKKNKKKGGVRLIELQIQILKIHKSSMGLGETQQLAQPQMPGKFWYRFLFHARTDQLIKN
jgi:hypothetical protein